MLKRNKMGPYPCRVGPSKIFDDRKASESRHTLVELCGEKRVSFTWQESMTWVTSSMVMEVSASVIEMVRVPTCMESSAMLGMSNKLTSCLAMKPLCSADIIFFKKYSLCSTSTPLNPLSPLLRNSKSRLCDTWGSCLPITARSWTRIELLKLIALSCTRLHLSSLFKSHNFAVHSEFLWLRLSWLRSWQCL